MSTHNICFQGEIGKIVCLFFLFQTMPYLELCKPVYNIA